jgi:subtilisin family serine protease
MKAFRSVLVFAALGGLPAAGGCHDEGAEGARGAEGAALDEGAARLVRGGASRASVLVYLKGAADLGPSRALATPAQKGAFVYRALADHAERAQGPLLAWLAGRGASARAFHVVNAVAVYDATPELVRALAARPDVARIAVDRPFKLRLPKVDASDASDASAAAAEGEAVAAPGSNLVTAGAVRVWDEFQVRGEGVVVAGQDTGIEWTHPGLRAHYRGGSGASVDHRYSWHDAIHRPAGGGGNPCGYDAPAPCDDNGHGTHTMGTMVGDDGNGNQVGMAPGAKWIGCRNMDEGEGTASRYIECFEWFLAPYPPGGNPRTDGDPSRAPDVINNSWGCPASEGCQGAEIVPVLQTLAQAGIVVVASAGNEGPGCGTIEAQPATASNVTLSVGAYNHRNGSIASFSSRGPSDLDGQTGPDVTAPGVSIRSTVPGGRYAGSSWSGTSMAGPHVAGEVALLLSADPSLRGKVDEITDVVRSTSRPRTSSQSCGGVSGSARPNNTFGWGTIDAYAAVASRVSPD